MYAQVEKPKENRMLAKSVTQKERNRKYGLCFMDNRKKLLSNGRNILKNDTNNNELMSKGNETGEYSIQRKVIPLTNNVAQLINKEIGFTVGAWILTIKGASADVWESNDGLWKMSYYRETHDYHIKGKTGSRARSHKGKFNGVFNMIEPSLQQDAERMHALYENFEQGAMGHY